MTAFDPPDPPPDPFAEFDRLMAAVSRHIPRGAAGTVVAITSRGITVAEPGVSIGDLSALLGDVAGTDDPLPAGLVLRDVTLRSLRLVRAPVTNDVTLDFTVTFAPADPLPIVPGLDFRAAGLTGHYGAGGFFAEIAARLTIEAYDIDATLQLPAQILRARIAPGDPAAGLLADRGVVGAAAGHTLQAFEVQAHIPLRRATAYVALARPLSLGPVAVVFAEGHMAVGHGVSASLHADLEISLGGGQPPLALGAEADIDSQGWRIAGTLDLPAHAATLRDLVDGMTDALGADRQPLPDRLASLSLRHVAVRLDSHAGEIGLEVGLDWDGGGDVRVAVDARGGAVTVQVELHVGDAILDVVFDKGETSVLGAVWRNHGGRPLDLASVLGALHDGTPPIPSLPVALRGVGLVSTMSGDILAVTDIAAGIDLSRLGKLPVVGALLPPGAEIGLNVAPFYMSAGFDAASVATARAMLGDIGHLPDTPQAGLHPVVELKLGALSRVLDETETGAPPPPGAQGAGPSAPAAPEDDGMSWTDLDAHLGPLHLRRGGYRLVPADPKTGTGRSLALALDADLAVAGLSLSLSGLGAAYRFDDGSVTPQLTGMGLDIKRGEVEIGAAFLNMDGDFGGALTVAAPGFALHALGQFAMIDNVPSIFAFGALDMPLGGPVFFFVEGLSAGIGVHRSLHLPDLDRLADFPLIAAAGAVGTPKPPDPDPLRQLELLHAYVRPQLGRYFIAAGIKFNSFRIVNGNVLAIAQAGKRLELDVLGVASSTFPPDLPPGSPAMANIALTIAARFSPQAGTLRVDGRLDPRSYVYSPLCHLSGGFAFRAWFTGPRAGDFILSVGGYSTRIPGWRPPDHYPHVPRIEMKFQVSDAVCLKGDAYFAMTQSMAMAGGGLHAQVDLGNLHAWADFSIDFFLGWEPFHYFAAAHIGIGARWKCFHTHASADLRVWGPDFSGAASVDWWIFSFDIEFGAAAATPPLPISFDKFKRSFLGIGIEAGDGGDILGLVVARGQNGKAGDAVVVDPSGLALRLSTRVPADHVALDGATQRRAEAGRIGLPPLWGVSPGASTLRITVTRDGQALDGVFDIAAVDTQAFPAALWAPVAQPDIHTPGVTAVSGLTLIPRAPPPVPVGSLALPAGKFRYPLPEDVPQLGYDVAGMAAPGSRPSADLLRRNLVDLGLDMTDLEVPDGP